MKTRPTPPLTPAQREALEARFALRLSARLEEGAQGVPHDIAERLRVAREQAVRAAREARTAAAPVLAPASAPVAVGGLGGAGAGGGQVQAGMGLLGGWQSGESEARHARATSRGRRLDEGPLSWGWRFATVLPAIALVVGLWGIHRYAKHEQVEAATDIDMQLLADDLPPDAYADPGFEEFLNRDTGPAVRPIEDAPPEIGGDLSTTETEADLAEGETEPAVGTP